MVCENCVRLALCGWRAAPHGLSQPIVRHHGGHNVVPPGGGLRRPTRTRPRLRWRPTIQSMPESAENELYTVHSGVYFLLIVCLPFISLVLMSDDLTPITILLALISIMTIVAEVTSRIARCNFIKQLNLQQREFLHAAEQVRAIRLCSQ